VSEMSSSLPEASYEGLREALAPEYADMPTEELEAVLEWSSGAHPEELESIFGTIADIGTRFGRGLQQALPVVAQRLPGIAQGAAQGAALGPYGALAGGFLGGITGGTTPPGQPPSPIAPAAATTATAAVPGGLPAPAAPAAVPPATARLLGALFHPQVLQALSAMVLGPAGRRTVPIAGTAVPVAAIPNALGVLANQAATEYNETIYDGGEGESVYLHGIADPEDPRARAEVVLTLLDKDTAQRRPHDDERLLGHGDDFLEADDDPDMDEDDLDAYRLGYEPVYGDGG
jgi:hypothetical protein